MEVAMEPQHTASFIWDQFPSHVSKRRLSIVLEESCTAWKQNGFRRPLSPDTDDSPAKRPRTGFSCAPCNMTFTEKRALARHKKTDHHRRQIGLPPDRRHACHMCGKHFTRGHDLKRHQNEQHTEVVALGVDVSSGGSEYSSEHVSPRNSQQRAFSTETDSPSPVTADAPAAVHVHPSLRATYSGPANCAEFLDCGTLPVIGNCSLLRRGNDVADVQTGSAMAITQQVPALDSLPELMHTDHTDSSEGSPESYRSSARQGSNATESPEDHSDLMSFDPASAQLRRTEIQSNAPTYARDVDVDSWQPLMCMVCGVAYEDDPEELVNHLRRHLDTTKGAYQCTECLIGFAHEEDLERHLQCAAEGHCGFSFPHMTPCTGHHPPRSCSNLAGLSDYDRTRLFDRLSHWEQAQLRAYMSEIDGLLARRRAPRANRWSDVIRGSPRRDSQSSFAISVKTFASAPCDGVEGELDVGGLRKRMQQMSIGNAKTRLSRIARNGSEHSQDAVNKALRKAVKYGQVPRVAEQLEAGGDPAIVQDEDHFVTNAMWGHRYVAEKMAEHRLEVDIMGECAKCGFKKPALDDPTNKVRAMLEHGADPNRRGGLRDYPLITAAWLGRPTVVQMLLNHYANVNLHASNYETALCAAASQAGSTGHVEVLNLLLQHGADANTQYRGGTALQLAKQRLELWSTDNANNKAETSEKVFNCQKVVTALEKVESAPCEKIPWAVVDKKRLHSSTSEATLDVYACFKV